MKHDNYISNYKFYPSERIQVQSDPEEIHTISKMHRL